MSGAALAQGGTLLTRAPIELRVEDRLPSLPIRRMSAAMVGVAAGSLLVHLGLMAGALVVAHAPLPIPAEKEIAVEVVQEAPKAEAPKPPAPAPKVEQAKLEPPKPEAIKPEPAKTEPTKSAPAKQEQAQRPPQPVPPPPAQKAAAPADDGKLQQLQDELAHLRAEQAALKAETARAGSGKAVALATSTDGDGEMVDYQLLVFSQLAKAKELTRFKGGIGTTGVKFLIDEAGRLARAEIVAPSGDAALDREALAIVNRAAPFPPPPKDADRIVFANVNFVAPKQP